MDPSIREVRPVIGEPHEWEVWEPAHRREPARRLASFGPSFNSRRVPADEGYVNAMAFADLHPVEAK